jgi:hypothetical protein
MIGLLVQYYLSIDDCRFVTVVMLGALSLVLGLWAFHATLAQVLLVLNVTGAGVLLVGESWCQGVIGSD